MKKQNDNNIKSRLINKVNFKLYEMIILIIFLVAITVTTTITLTKATTKQIEPEVTISLRQEGLERFIDTYNLIKNDYYTQIDEEKAVSGAIDGLLKSLDDQHTMYFAPEENKQFNEVMSGKYKGIGAEISTDLNDKAIIYSTFKNSPAERSGLKPNDIIISVNDISAENMSISEVVKIIKDPKKVDAKIIISRDGVEKEFNIIKEEILLETIDSQIIEEQGKKIGYIEINIFGDNTYDQFKTHLIDLESKGITSLILDVRSNSGGYLDSVTQMLDLFIEKDEVCYQMVDKTDTKLYRAKNAENRKYPIAILINEGSASASEILTIALREKKNAIIVGKKSYGKGTVQSVIEYNDGSMIKYTIKKWLSPNGKWIDKEGIMPDIEVDISKEYKDNPGINTDNQLQKAIKSIIK